MGEGLALPAHQGELMAQIQQEGHQFTPHESRTSEQQQSHARLLTMGGG
jgi:hypothetical protein